MASSNMCLRSSPHFRRPPSQPGLQGRRGREIGYAISKGTEYSAVGKAADEKGNEGPERRFQDTGRYGFATR